jgi:predicted O-methyltransferase YrrM
MGHSLVISEALWDYIRRVSLREPEPLCRLREATADYPNIQMQIAPEQAQFMALLVELTGAQQILEVGTFLGYSSLALALALPPDGHLITCDLDATTGAIARRYWEAAGVGDRIEQRLGPAEATLRQLLAAGGSGRFDLMFIDADKRGYDTYVELGLQLLRPGGLLLLDNTLWSGRVADATVADPRTEALRQLNLKLHRDERVSLSLVPIGDGLTLARKR